MKRRWMHTLFSFRNRMAIIAVGVALGAVSLLFTDNMARQLQQKEHVGVVDLPEAGQGVSVDLLDGDDAGVVSVDFAEGILEGTGQNFLVRYVEDALVDLLGGLAVQGAQYVVGPVRVGGDEAVVPQLVVDVFLIGLHPAAPIPHQAVGHGVGIHPAVGGDPALAAGAPHQGDAPLVEDGVDGGQHAGVIPGTKVNTHRVAAGASYRLHVPLHPLDILHRHGGHFL